MFDRASESVEGDGGASRADSWVEDRRRPKEEVDTPRMEVISRGGFGCYHTWLLGHRVWTKLYVWFANKGV